MCGKRNLWYEYVVFQVLANDFFLSFSHANWFVLKNLNTFFFCACDAATPFGRSDIETYCFLMGICPRQSSMWYVRYYAVSESFC